MKEQRDVGERSGYQAVYPPPHTHEKATLQGATQKGEEIMQVIKQASKRNSGLRPWSRALGVSVFALIFGASQAQALPIETATSGFFYSTDPDPNGLTTAWYIHSGFDSLGSNLVCSTVAESAIVEPTGACDPGERELALIPDTLRSHCRVEGTPSIFNYTATGTGCLPPSCLDNDAATTCSVQYRGTAKLEGGSGLAKGSSGSFTYTQTYTYTDFNGGTINQKTKGDFEFTVLPSTKANNDLIAAVRGGDREGVLTALFQGADVNVRDGANANETPLFYVNKPEIAGLLLSIGAAVNVRNNFGMTPLHDASILGRIEIVRLLLEAGAAPYARDESGWTPLDWVEDPPPWGVPQASDELIQLLEDAGGQ